MATPECLFDVFLSLFDVSLIQGTLADPVEVMCGPSSVQPHRVSSQLYAQQRKLTDMQLRALKYVCLPEAGSPQQPWAPSGDRVRPSPVTLSGHRQEEASSFKMGQSGPLEEREIFP